MQILPSGLAIVPVVLALAAPCTNASAAESSISLSQLKKEVEKAIRNAQVVSDAAPYFIIERVELELQGESESTGGGGFTIPIFGVGVNLGAEGATTTTEKVALELVPPERAIVGGEDLVDFTNLIRELKQTFRNEQEGDAGLLASKIVYTKTWTLQRKAEGGIDVVVAKANVAIAEDKSQTVVFHLCQTINLTDCVGD